MITLYDHSDSPRFHDPIELSELINALPDLPLFNEDLPFDNRPFIIPLFKPAGISSFDVIRKVRKKIISHLGKGKGRRKLKIGHFGTLDPFAEGILLVGTGKAMKLMSMIQDQLPKSYCALGVIGIKTLTGDCEGEIIEKVELSEEELSNIYREIENTASTLEGKYWQKPPYFSAVKHEGRPLYDYAREGIFIEKEAVEREIYSLNLLENPTTIKDEVLFECSVSNGTYIRTLWQDLLPHLRGAGHLKALKRSKIGNLNISQTILPDDFIDREDFYALSPVDIISLETISFNLTEALDLLQGRSLIRINEGDQGMEGPFWAYYGSHLLGIGEIKLLTDNRLEVKIDTLLFGLGKKDQIKS